MHGQKLMDKKTFYNFANVLPVTMLLLIFVQFPPSIIQHATMIKIVGRNITLLTYQNALVNMNKYLTNPSPQ